jgi:hypothetical protein
MGPTSSEVGPRTSYGAAARLEQGVSNGDVMARATGHGVEFWHRLGKPVLTPPPVPR